MPPVGFRTIPRSDSTKRARAAVCRGPQLMARRARVAQCRAQGGPLRHAVLAWVVTGCAAYGVAPSAVGESHGRRPRRFRTRSASPNGRTKIFFPFHILTRPRRTSRSLLHCGTLHFASPAARRRRKAPGPREPRAGTVPATSRKIMSPPRVVLGRGIRPRCWGVSAAQASVGILVLPGFLAPCQSRGTRAECSAPLGTSPLLLRGHPSGSFAGLRRSRERVIAAFSMTFGEQQSGERSLDDIQSWNARLQALCSGRARADQKNVVVTEQSRSARKMLMMA